MSGLFHVHLIDGAVDDGKEGREENVISSRDANAAIRNAEVNVIWW